MAKNAGVWGIDIGQCALKAMRCTIEDGQVVADAFDYIEYPKILTQPEANPEELIQEATSVRDGSTLCGGTANLARKLDLSLF